MSLPVAGLALAMVAVASFAGNVLGGSLADRFGPRRALMVGLGAGAAGATWFAFVHSATSAFGAAAVIGLGASIAWPSADALLASAVDDSQRSSVFAIRHGTMNAGFGVGAVAAALIVDLWPRRAASSFCTSSTRRPSWRSCRCSRRCAASASASPRKTAVGAATVSCWPIARSSRCG